MARSIIAIRPAPDRPFRRESRPAHVHLAQRPNAQGLSQTQGALGLDSGLRAPSSELRRARDGAAGDGDQVDAVAVALAVGQVVPEVGARRTHRLAVAQHAPGAFERRRSHADPHVLVAQEYGRAHPKGAPAPPSLSAPTRRWGFSLTAQGAALSKHAGLRGRVAARAAVSMGTSARACRACSPTRPRRP